jgi:glycine/D-amino acid oxidase-like deaminating enzyme
MTDSARFVVVGGGVVAAAVAYHLTRLGASVVVVAGDQAGAATGAGAGIICPWTAPLDDAFYRLCCEGARHYPGLVAMLADDGEAEASYARVGTVWAAGQAGAPQQMAALLGSRRAGAPDMGEVTALTPGAPARLFSTAPPWAG